MATAPNSPQAEQWLAENHDALESSNAYIEEHGLPLARYWHEVLTGRAGADDNGIANKGGATEGE